MPFLKLPYVFDKLSKQFVLNIIVMQKAMGFYHKQKEFYCGNGELLLFIRFLFLQYLKYLLCLVRFIVFISVEMIMFHILASLIPSCILFKVLSRILL